MKTYDEISRHSNYVLDHNWQKQRQSILSSVSKHDQSYLDEANAMQVEEVFHFSLKTFISFVRSNVLKLLEHYHEDYPMLKQPMPEL